MRDKKFVINSIKMDLHRVVNASGNINKTLPTQSIVEFIEHAEQDFGKVELTESETILREQLQNLLQQLSDIKDPFTRLRWTEDILTIRCRL